MAEEALRHEGQLERMLENRNRVAAGRPPPQQADALESAKKSKEATQSVLDMLSKLFPEPQQVLQPKQLSQLDSMAEKQRQLEQEASELGQRMDALSQELPLFGGQPRASLGAARKEMQQAGGKFKSKRLPGAAGHERKALEHLGDLRKSLEQASQKSGGGLPLPLGSPGGSRQGRSGSRSREEVEIPHQNKQKAPGFRLELLEAAKQKAPEQFEDAVRRYYEELIR
jgi:DNA repair exonuclease SbcCD ATPase subunit